MAILGIIFFIIDIIAFSVLGLVLLKMFAEEMACRHYIEYDNDDCVWSKIDNALRFLY